MEETVTVINPDGREVSLSPNTKKAKKPRQRRPKPVEHIHSLKLIQEVHNGAYFWIHFPEEESEKLAPLVSAIPGMQYIKTVPFNPNNEPIIPETAVLIQQYRVNASEESLQMLAKFGKQHKFDFGGDIAVRANASSEEGKELARISYAKDNRSIVLPKFAINPQTRKPFKPFPFQRAGVAYALKAKKTFIADEMGLGKTIQAIALSAKVQKWPWLIVCPSSLKGNWEKEYKQWLSTKKLRIHWMRPRQMPRLDKCTTDKQRKRCLKQAKQLLERYDVVIINYDKIQRWVTQLEQIKWNGIVFDESHYLKNNSSKRTQNCARLVEATDPEYVLMLSGTPITNRPIELIPQLRILGRIQDFGGTTHFINRYCSFVNLDPDKLPKFRKPSGEETLEPQTAEDQDIARKLQDEMVRKAYENMTELNQRLRSICYVRREKADVLADLPPKTRSTLLLDINNRQDYDRAERDVISYLMDYAVKDEKFQISIRELSKEEQVRKIKERRADVEYLSARAEALRRIEVCKQTAAVGKLQGVKQWIDDVVDNGEKLILFCTHTKILQELLAYYPKAVTIHGGTSQAQRDLAVLKFQDDPKTKIFIGTLQAAGVGLTLTAAHQVGIVELGWTPAIHDQAEDRAHRITQKSAVNVTYLLAKSTIEERIGKLLEQKRMVVDSVSFGDPLAKGREMGTIAGSLISELTSKIVL